MRRMYSEKQIEDIVKNLAEGKELPLPNVYVVDNVKTLSNEDIEQLRAGDIVVKKDASGNHPYMVSFRGETGICLTYTDASCVETQSYDLVDGQWTYNSEDKTEFPMNDLELEISAPATIFTNLTKKFAYCKMIRRDKILEIIICARYDNETESAVSMSSNTNIFSSSLTNLPEELTKRIYRLDGTKVNEAVGDEGGIVQEVGVGFVSSASKQPIFINIYSNTINQMNFALSTGSSISVPASGKVLLNVRTFLSL